MIFSEAYVIQISNDIIYYCVMAMSNIQWLYLHYYSIMDNGLPYLCIMLYDITFCSNPRSRLEAGALLIVTRYITVN